MTEVLNLWDMTPCLLVSSYRKFSSRTTWILKMETNSFSETSVTNFQSTLQNIPKDSKLHQRRCDSLKSKWRQSQLVGEEGPDMCCYENGGGGGAKKRAVLSRNIFFLWISIVRLIFHTKNRMPYVKPTSVCPLVIQHQRLNRLSNFHENR